MAPDPWPLSKPYMPGCTLSNRCRLCDALSTATAESLNSTVHTPPPGVLAHFHKFQMASKDACGKLTTLENTVEKADEQSMRPACQVFDYDTAAVQKAIRDDASANLAVAQQGTDTSLAALATELAAAIAAECADALVARTDVEAADLNGHAQPSPKLDKDKAQLLQVKADLAVEKGS